MAIAARHAATKPDVYWLIQAQDALQNSLGGENRKAGAYERQIDELSHVLARTFPQAEAVLVANWRWS